MPLKRCIIYCYRLLQVRGKKTIMQGRLRNAPPVKPTLWLSIVALGLLLLLAACGSSGTTAASSGASTTSASAASTPATSNSASSSAQASNTTGGNDYGGGGYGKYGNTGAATPAPKPTTAATPVASASTPVPPTPTPAVGSATKAVTITTINGTFGFSPASLTIPVGTTVIWTNMTGAPHTVTSDDGKTFDSGMNTPIGQGATFSFKFTKPGKYSYHCQFHPYMVATIIVQ
jgi:plastocyanin